MNGQHSIELNTVSNRGRLYNAVEVGGDTPAVTNQAEAGNLGGDALRSSGGAGHGRGGAGGASVAPPPPLSQVGSQRSGRNNNSAPRALGRTSMIIFKSLQQGGRDLIDQGKLRAHWLSNTLVKRSEAQDYVNEDDQGVVTLLARHVVVPAAAWQKLGADDGQFWQPNGPGDFARNSNATPHRAVTSSDNRPEEQGNPASTSNPREGKPCRSIFCISVIQPYAPFAVFWTTGILLLDLTYTAFWVPMNVGFCTSEYGKWPSGCTTSDLVGGALYLLNTLFGFQIGLVATYGIRKRTVVDGKMVAWLYVRYGRFLVDVLASVPLVYLVVVLAGQTHFRLNKVWVNCLSLLRLLRMVRLLRISKVVYTDSLSGRFQDIWLARKLSVTGLYSMFLAYLLAVLINLFACIMVLCAYFEGYDKSWMTAVDWTDLPDASPIYQWYCAVYWMIVTATTTGFGDFAPRSVAEQVVANVVMVGGMIMFGVLVASIGQALSRATREAHQAYNARQKIIRVMEWGEHRQLPEHIRKQVQNYFVDKYGQKEEAVIDVTMMAALPSRLRCNVARALCAPLVSAVHIFSSLPENVQTLLAEIMRPIRLPAGEDLCQQGDVTNCLWILQEGTVQAARYKEDSVTLDSAMLPRLLGESVLLAEGVEASRVRPWTLRTVTPCKLWGITIGELYPLMRMYPAIGEEAAKYVKDEAGREFMKQALGRSNSLQESNTPDAPWCEVAAVIARQLQNVSDVKAKKLILELTNAADGILQARLQQLLVGSSSSMRRDTGIHSATVQAETTTAAAAPPPPAAGGTTGGLDFPVAAPNAACIGAADNPQQQQQQQPPVSPALARASVRPVNTVFATPTAAAALEAALRGHAARPGQHRDPGAQQPHPQPLNGPGLGPPGVSEQQGTSVANRGVARLSPQPSTASSLTAVRCPGCQRCICPSCGQGTDSVAPLAAPAPTPTPAAAAAAATAARPGVVGPGKRAWVSRVDTLRRVSIGPRADHLWVSERNSMDRRPGALSMMSDE
ncbi:hypothetical protein VaNZ11_003210 [Volvox africanus]|uniref:Cyclic nucleotide-binding domain-containing protein n=1 Tax=Volvox africanus TaxID=51714 RepID=A0ABQ5RUP7_9CHLO|nr:hypothetical protein VaNZ11_003210 [Volvox africanus]